MAAAIPIFDQGNYLFSRVTGSGFRSSSRPIELTFLGM